MQDSYNQIFKDSKSHYEILDGLRGVAAIMVVLFHILEILSGGDHTKQIINHGYLAVDFFFLLSGFVIGHAYDDRWGKMTLSGFFKRRLIRLHPMIVAGMLIGAIGFYYSASPILFPGIASVPLWKLLLVMFIGITLLPVPTSLEIRGWGELHPLNGPAWSLFYEYIGNILYAFVFRKMSNLVLSIFVIIAAIALIHFATTNANGDIIGGWSIDIAQIRVGLTRLLFPFLAGLMIARVYVKGNIKNGFFWSSVLLVLMLSIPRLGDQNHHWVNGLYDALTIIFVFPLIVYIGASGNINNAISMKICKWLGDISYPLYITHYPIIYVYSAWIVDNSKTISSGQLWIAGILVLISSLTIATLCLQFYDLPIRKWLAKKWLQ